METSVIVKGQGPRLGPWLGPRERREQRARTVTWDPPASTGAFAAGGQRALWDGDPRGRPPARVSLLVGGGGAAVGVSVRMGEKEGPANRASRGSQNVLVTVTRRAVSAPRTRRK